MKSALVRAILEFSTTHNVHMTKVFANRLSDEVMRTIRDQVVTQGRFTYHNFGSLLLRTRAQRTITSGLPRVGPSPITVPEHKTVVFRPSAFLKESLKP
mmetsp:Transcript_2642/g.7280  ORF Transcript_2642/g.7280 Transcript_2642/m.7280 type:complete len:99 (+) Transcript_2642:42-338(+)